jgi:hypothetical protein
LALVVEEDPRRVVPDDLDGLGVELLAARPVGRSTSGIENLVDLFVLVEAAVVPVGVPLSAVKQCVEPVVGVEGNGSPSEEERVILGLLRRLTGEIEVARPMPTSES